MISNLKAARQAIKAELSHAKQDIAFYMSRVEALETALQQLESAEGEHSAAPAKGVKSQAGAQADNGRKRGRKEHGAEHGAAKSNGAKRKRRAAEAADADGLPRTGGDFWLSLVSNEPRSAVDISSAAISALGIAPDQKELIQKVKQRVNPALASLVAAQKIKDSGEGRERRFFKE